MGAVDRMASALNGHLDQADADDEGQEAGRIVALALDQLFPYRSTQIIISQAYEYVTEAGECDECDRLAQADDPLCSTCAWERDEA